jgi:hypothetical protein
MHCSRAVAKDGKLVLPDGMSYRLLVLPGSDRMTQEVAEKIGELARAGVPVIGPKPGQSYSLTDYPRNDERLRRVVADSWDKVRAGATPQQVFEQVGLLPDVEFIGVNMTPEYRKEMGYASPPLCWTHRRTDEADIYFLSNQDRQSRSVDVAFRVEGRIPELWNAETGEIRDAMVRRSKGGRTIVPLQLDPAGSVFVVFHRPSQQADPISRIDPMVDASAALPPLWIENGRVLVSRNGEWVLTRKSGRSHRISIDGVPAVQQIKGPWKMAFPPGRGAPDSIDLPELIPLNEHADFGVKHFSGTATYRKAFDFTPQASSDRKRYFLDLGNVKNLVEVCVNNKTVGVLWKPPYRIEITDALKPGQNSVELKVTNTWKNRLIGDAALPPGQRIGWTALRDVWFKKDAALEPAGLIGPVTIHTVIDKPLQ